MAAPREFDYVHQIEVALENIRGPLNSINPRERVQAMYHLLASTQIIERRIIAEARADGMTWESIGEIYGRITKQAAQQRFRLDALE